MPMRQDDGFYRSELDAENVCIAQKGRALGAGVEQQASAFGLRTGS